jgi:cytochrome c-type biogenesis protein CcmH
MLAAFALLPLLAAAGPLTTKEIEEALTCQCGCGLTVHSCNHLSCGSGIPLKQEVSMMVNQGLGRDEILVHFRDKYGEKILSSPTAEGFNLTAWIFPFVMLAAGAVIVFVAVRRWSLRGEEAASESLPAELTVEERQRLEVELRRAGD